MSDSFKLEIPKLIQSRQSKKNKVSNHFQLSSKSSNKSKKAKKGNFKTVANICNNYRFNVFGKENKNIYNSCKINQYCRKTKCKNIDKKFSDARIKKLGNHYSQPLMISVFKKCPVDMNDKKRKKCTAKAITEYYNKNDLGDIYNKVLECDKETCAKERKIFRENIYRANKLKKRIHIPKTINLVDIPDKEMLEIL
jgi:hypothetical protein